ncbi:histidine kinase [Asanoa ishikariensis]|uniref:histidine kinase n=1 Tax=Asanoa ishikariensis TaxID=137265 RepID=A0A1H3LTQ0_9ACTN|nr:sensor histidine kinase [Asanoa ishikariensis]GIF65690.1 histidine kinase [Asanoa ishikariensis]SDY67743.1 HAMP domain-containing protein [Asanoa ishikariensis]
MRTWTLRRRLVTLTTLVGVVLVLIAVVAATVAAQNRNHLDTLLDKTGPLRTSAQGLQTALLNQETGVRGYAVSGDRNDLVPYTEGVAAEQRLVAVMRPLLDDEPDIARQLDRIEEQAAAWRSSVAEPVVSAPDVATARSFITDQARQRFDEMRASLDELQRQMLELRDTVAGKARETGNTLVFLLVVAAAVIIVAGVALLVSLNRVVIGPVTDLADQVRDVRAGDYQRKITGIGPPELSRLAADIDAMREQIAADLSEVGAARERIEWVNGQLQRQAEELIRSNRDLEQFAYVASHDLQEPLRKVASFCQLLQRRYAGQLDERADQYIAFAVDGAQRMQRLINDLLAFSRIGRATAGFTEIDLDRVMVQVSSQTESAREYAGGELVFHDLPTVLGEEALLTNLLTNLVSNSIKFRRPGVAPRVEVSARQIGEEWEISCADNGIGVEPEFADKIFVIFQRLHSKDAYPGTGIGLAIAKKIVEYHGGRIWVDVDATEGTIIRFTLPVIADAPTDDDTPEADQPPAQAEPTHDTTGVKEVAA